MKIDMEVMKKVVRARWMRARYGLVETIVSAAGCELVDRLAQACEGMPRSKWACRVVRYACEGELDKASAAIAAAGVAFAKATEDDDGGEGAAANALMWATAEVARRVVASGWDPDAFGVARAAWATFVGWRCDVYGHVVDPDDDPVMIRGGDENAAAEIEALDRLARGDYPANEEVYNDLPF